jgi:PBSX family phage terminase large subunit
MSSADLVRLKKRPYTPYGAARKLWGCRDEEILMEGPAGTGKSRAVLEKIFLAMMKYPGARALIVRKTRESMTDSVLVTFEEKVVPGDNPVLEGPMRRLRGSYTFPNGSEIVVGGMDKASKVMSTEYDIVGCFEATELTEEDFENLTTRLRNGVMPYQQIIADCNPGAPSHWLNKRANKGHMTRLQSRHRDNPVMFDMKLREFTPFGQKYLRKLDRLSGVRRSRLLEGKWHASEGMVYDNWNEQEHLIDRMPAGWERWRKIRGIDLGMRNPFVCLWAAIDHDGDIYVYREIYKTNRIVRDHASGVWDEKDGKRTLIRPGIKQFSEGDGEIEATVSDHDAEDRATLDAEGVDTTPAHKDILPGIEAVYNRLRPSLHGDGTVRPRLYFLRDALVEKDEDLIDEGLPFSTVQEFDGYTYAKPKEGKAPKEEPIDKDNHGMDTIRYIVSYVDDLGGTQIDVSAELPTIVQ